MRIVSYDVGRKHDQALIDCGYMLIRRDLDAAERAVSHHTMIAKEYGQALSRLGDHLSKLEQTPETVEETRRVNRLLDLLDREVDTVVHRLEILKAHQNL